MSAITRRNLLATLPFAVGAAAAQSGARVPAPASDFTSIDYDTDVVVCGGGPAGIAAALNAARLGAKVILL